MQVAVVIPGQHQTALTGALQQGPSGVERLQGDVAQLSRDLHEPAEVRHPHAEQFGPLRGDTGQEGPLTHQHAQLAHEVARFDHEDDAIVATVDEQDTAGQDEVQVVGVAGLPQHLTGLGPQHLTGRPKQLNACSLKTGHARASTPSCRADE